MSKKFFQNVLNKLEKIIALEYSLADETDKKAIEKKEKKLESLEGKVISLLIKNYSKLFNEKYQSFDELSNFIRQNDIYNYNEMSAKYYEYMNIIIDRFTLGDYFVPDKDNIQSLYVPFLIPVVVFDSDNKATKNKDLKINPDKFVGLFKKHNLLSECATIFVEGDLYSVEDINIGFDQQVEYTNSFFNRIQSKGITKDSFVSPFKTNNSKLLDLNYNETTNLRFISGGFLSLHSDTFPVISEINDIEEDKDSKLYLSNLTNFFKEFGTLLKEDLDVYNITNVVHGFPSELTKSLENGVLLLDSVTLSTIARKVNLIGAEINTVPSVNVIINPKDIYIQFKLNKKIVSLFKITATNLPFFDIYLTLEHIKEVLHQECYKTNILKDPELRDGEFYSENSPSNTINIKEVKDFLH